MSKQFQVYEFTSNGGKTTDASGQSHWPCCLYVNIPKRQLAEFIRQAVNALDHSEDLQISMMGEIVRDVEQDNGEPIRDSPQH